MNRVAANVSSHTRISFSFVRFAPTDVGGYILLQKREKIDGARVRADAVGLE